MKRFNEATLTVKMLVIALPLTIAGAIVAAVIGSTFTYGRVDVRPLADYSPGQYPGGSGTPPPGYTSSPSYTAPPPAQPASQPPASSAPPASSPPPSSSPPPPSSPPPSSTPPASSTPAPASSGTSQPSQQQPAGSASQPPNTGGNPGTPPPTFTHPTEQPGGTPPPPPGSFQPNGSSAPPSGPPPAGNNQPSATTNQAAPPAAPPVLTVNDPSTCIEHVLGADAASKFRSGSFTPSNDQISIANSAGCFSAQVSAGPPPPGIQGGPNSNAFTQQAPTQGGQHPMPPALALITVAPPPQFQPDSPTVSCAKQIIGADQFSRGAQPTPDQLAQLQSKCFAPTAAPGQLLLATPDGRPIAGPSANQATATTPPSLPPEIKSCVLKAGITEADINAIQNGQPPTEKQQQQGEACFNKFAHDKGYALPTLTPPDPSQPFDPHSKQNECADLVAATHGIHFNQINPAIVANWGADDISKLRSCYGVAATGSAPTNGMIFAPTSTQVAIPAGKLNCIEQAVGATKLAAIVAGTTSVSDADRENVYNKCINPNKIAPNANPALLGVLAAMPPSDLESQFIPVNAQQMPQPSTNDNSQTDNGEVAISGEVDVPAGKTLPSKVDVFVKSTPRLFTVALSKVNATKATWTVKVAHNKLPLGNHKAYAVATLADATQVRSPEVAFAIVTKAASNSSLAVAVGVAITSLAAGVGAWLAWRWHARHSRPIA